MRTHTQWWPADSPLSSAQGFWRSGFQPSPPSEVSHDVADVVCTCSTPWAGTAGDNGIQCSDGTSTWCASTQACITRGNFSKADLSSACEEPTFRNCRALVVPANTLRQGECIQSNGSGLLENTKGKLKCVVELDGNFACFVGETQPRQWWSSNTTGQGVAPYTLFLQYDGNLVLFDARGRPLWASQTERRSVAFWVPKKCQVSKVTLNQESGLSVMALNAYFGGGQIGCDWMAPWRMPLLTCKLLSQPSSSLEPGECLLSSNAVNYLIEMSSTQTYTCNNTGEVRICNTSTNADRRCEIQSDGNFVCYQDGDAWWASKSGGMYGAVNFQPPFILENAGGNLIISSSSHALMWTPLQGKFPGAEEIGPGDMATWHLRGGRLLAQAPNTSLTWSTPVAPSKEDCGVCTKF